MKTITLSSYIMDCLEAAAQARAARYEAAMRDYQEALSRRQECIDEARGLAFAAARRWQLGLAIRSAYRAWQYARVPFPARPTPALISDDERKKMAGAQGEAMVAKHLGRMLDDEWTLICGYTNKGGELDQLLIGPTGVFALEIKYVNGDIAVHGDYWTRTLRMRQGIKWNAVVDGGGRSPSQQLNATADGVQRSVGRVIPNLPVGRIVVLSHPRATVVALKAPTAQVVTLPTWRLETSLGPWQRILSAGQCTALVEAVCHHHGPQTSLHRRAA